MKTFLAPAARIPVGALAAACLVASIALPLAAAEPEAQADFKPIFNGTDLTGWGGLPQFWSVKDGAITGQTTAETPAKNNTFLIWRGGDVGDFELRLSYKITANNDVGFANSGIQYRSKIADRSYFVVGGYQADMEAGKTYSGILYEERGRGILANRGQKVIVHPDPSDPNKHKLEVVGTLGKSEDIQAKIKPNDWNEYVIIAQGNHLQHFINGMQTVDVIDEQTAKAAKTGILALQLHAGQPMTVQFKDLRLKSLSVHASAKSDVDHIQGDWVAAELIENGESTSADALAAFKLKVTGTAFSLKHPDGLYEGKFAVKETASPKSVDITLDDGTEVAGIYEMSDDTMKLCYAQPGSSRPGNFRSSAGSDLTVAVYKRKN